MYKHTKARREVKRRIIAYCHELFLNCDTEKIYSWGNYLSPNCMEAQKIINIAKKKLGYHKSYNDRDIFWGLQRHWR